MNLNLIAFVFGGVCAILNYHQGDMFWFWTNGILSVINLALAIAIHYEKRRT